MLQSLWLRGSVVPRPRQLVLLARPSPVGELARVVAQLGCDRGLHQHMPLRVPAVRGVNILADTAMPSHINTASWESQINQVMGECDADISPDRSDKQRDSCGLMRLSSNTLNGRHHVRHRPKWT